MPTRNNSILHHSKQHGFANQNTMMMDRPGHTYTRSSGAHSRRRQPHLQPRIDDACSGARHVPGSSEARSLSARHRPRRGRLGQRAHVYGLPGRLSLTTSPVGPHERFSGTSGGQPMDVPRVHEPVNRQQHDSGVSDGTALMSWTIFRALLTSLLLVFFLSAGGSHAGGIHYSDIVAGMEWTCAFCGTCVVPKEGTAAARTCVFYSTRFIVRKAKQYPPTMCH